METMTKLTKAAGFVDIRRRDFDGALDNPARLVGSMYVECNKPGTSTAQDELWSRSQSSHRPPALAAG
jgi:hypothetical protein